MSVMQQISTNSSSTLLNCSSQVGIKFSDKQTVGSGNMSNYALAKI